MRYTITRIRSDNNGTFGEWVDESGNEVCKTVELPWCDNEIDKSCVPIGTYTCTIYQSPRHGQVWMLQDVPGRSNCEIHAANTILDLEGCIGVGNAFGVLAGLPAVLNSQSTMSVLRRLLPSTFLVNIVGDALQ